MKSAREIDCLIVGAGAIGVSIALELARRGRDVLLVERGSELAWGCSAGSAGLICPSHAPPLPSPQALTSGLRWMLRRDSPLYLKPRLKVIPWLVRFAASSTRARARAGTDLIRVLSQSSLELHAEHACRDGGDGFKRRGILNVFESEAGLAGGRQEASGTSPPAFVPRSSTERRRVRSSPH